MKNKICWSIIISALSFPLIMGCTNAPGAVKMQLTPQKESFAPAEPILIEATLTAGDDPVCLHKSYFVAIEMPGIDAEFTKESYGYDGKIIYCGTGIVESFLLAPILLPIALMDVGDCFSRYEVISKGSNKTLHLKIALQDSRLIVDEEDKNKNCMYTCKATEATNQLPPGRHKIRAKLMPHSGTYHHLLQIYPPPLFWIPYNHPVEAQTEIVIRNESR